MPASNTSKNHPAREYIERLEAALWDCYKLAGSDTDGMDYREASAAMVDFPERCVEAVEELRRDYKECLSEVPAL